MKLSRKQRDIRWQIEVVAYRCLHSVNYMEGLKGKDGRYWTFSQNCFGEISSLLWCHIFNSRNNDPIHYYNLFGNDQLVELGAEFSYKNVNSRVLSHAEIEKDKYPEFREQVVSFRNKFVSHREYNSTGVKYPDFPRLGKMCEMIRDILRETVDKELTLAPEDTDLMELQDYYEWRTNESILKEKKDEVANAKFGG